MSVHNISLAGSNTSSHVRKYTTFIPAVDMSTPVLDGTPCIKTPRSIGKNASGRACRSPLGDKTLDLNLVRIHVLWYICGGLITPPDLLAQLPTTLRS
jgi:hypothetical protein